MFLYIAMDHKQLNLRHLFTQLNDLTVLFLTI